MKKTLLLTITALCLLSLGVAAQDSWQWTRKMGTNHDYSGGTVYYPGKPCNLLSDGKGNQYAVFYITGDTFYYGDNYKRYIRGGDGYALCKIKCDGSLSWCKIITHGRKNKADIGTSIGGQLFFGKDENTIIFSAPYSIYSANYLDNDTTLGSNINGYTIIYDSTGVAKKKIVNMDKQQGLSVASGYFSRTNQYVSALRIDSTATNRILFYGQYLSPGEYFILLDSNFIFKKVVPIVKYNKSFAQWDSTQPAMLALSGMDNCHVFGSKVMFKTSTDFDTLLYTSNLLTPKFFVIGKDSIWAKDLPQLSTCIGYTCYNDTGGQEWTRFFYPNVGTTGAAPDNSEFDKTKKEFIIKRDNHGSWQYQNQSINTVAINGNRQSNIFKIDSNGNFLWQKGIEHSTMGAGDLTYLKSDINSKSELIVNVTLSTSSSIRGQLYLNGKVYQDNTSTFPNSKNILVAVSKDTIRIIDTNIDATRRTTIRQITVDLADNIYIYGIKTKDGCILNNDSSAIQYDLGQDNFIAKYGKATCSCDPLRSAYKTLDSTTEGRITLQYTGLPSDSVRYLWGDGSWTLAKPSTSPTTKIYNQTRSVTIICVSYNNCGQTDSFRKTYQITCTALTSRFSIKDSLNKTISLQYTGTATDSVRYLWGDGSSAWAVNPSTKLMTHTYSTVLDSVSVSAIVRNKCGQADTFRRWVRFCPKPSVVISIDTSQRLQNKISVAYTGPDSITYYWGDNTSTTQKSVTKTYGSGGAYLIKWVVRNKCGARDSLTKLVMVGSLSLSSIVNNSQIRIYPNPAKDVVYVYPIYNAISLYNALGQELRLSSKIEGDQVRIDLGLLPENIYYLKIEDEKGVTLKMERLEIKRR